MRLVIQLFLYNLFQLHTQCWKSWKLIYTHLTCRDNLSLTLQTIDM